MSRRGVDKSGAGAFLLHPAKDHSSVSYGRFHKIDFKGLVYVLSSGLTLFLIEEKLRLRLTETSPIGNATRLPARCQLEASEHVKLSFIFCLSLNKIPLRQNLASMICLLLHITRADARNDSIFFTPTVLCRA